MSSSTLVAITYRDLPTAHQAMTRLGRLQKERLIDIEDAVIAVNEGGKIRLDQSVKLTSAGALGGAAWGSLLGMLFLMPIAGMVVGAAYGALVGKFTDYGIDDAFVKELGSQVETGNAALFLLIRKATTDKVLAEMQEFGGTVLRTNMSADAEQRLQEALSSASGT